jgi:glycosyltransferase involved in cell wall biosynthesis
VAASLPTEGPLIAVCSLFRNSAATLDYYRAVIAAQACDGVRLAYSFVEGDSSDDTYDRLTTWAAEDDRVTLTRRDVEPVEDFEDRVRKWAELGNLALEGALATGADYVLWCESDLALPPDLLRQLIDAAAAGADIVAPAIFLGGMFYDTRGFRGLDGVRFTNEAPYHPDFVAHGLMPLSSVGSCVLFRREIFDAGVRFRGTYDDGLLVGICQDAAQLGFRTFMDSRLAVLHPTTAWRRQQYRLERVEVDCESSEDPLWQDVAQELAEVVTLTLGSVDYTGEEPLFDDVHAIVQRHLPGRPHRLRVSLVSEARKTYALTVQDLGRSA